MILQDKIKVFCYLGLLPFISIPIISWVSPKIAYDYGLFILFLNWSLVMAVFMEAYVKHIKGELWLVGARIDPAKYINQKDQVNPERFRKLLLNQREVEKILFAISAKGQTCIPIKIFWKGHLAKLEIALAKGKKNYDKKQAKKTADIKRDQERTLKKYK